MIVARVLAIDYGSRRIGLAISDPEGKIALPYRTIDTKQVPDVIGELQRIIQEEEIGAILVGFPEGSQEDNPVVQEIREFTEALRKELDATVETFDEAYTSSSALLKLREAQFAFKWHREKVDSISAAEMLREFLEERRR